MLYRLAQIAHQLDQDQKTDLADSIDAMLAKIVANNDSDRLKSTLRFLRDSNKTTEVPAFRDDDKLTELDAEIAQRHQIELDKQELLKDVAYSVQNLVQEKRTKMIDHSHKLMNPQIRLVFGDSWITLMLKPGLHEGDYVLSASIGNWKRGDILQFPLSLKSTVGKSWVDTVASTIVQKFDALS